MTYLLDTNICIYVIKNKPEQVFRRFRENFQQGLYISAITLAELEHGVQKSAKVEQNALALLQFLSTIPILSFGEEAAMEYGKICADLQRKGTSIGTMDMLIAAHAKALDMTLVTNNLREFERVEGLKLDNWV